MERRELTMLRPQELRSRAKDSSSSWGQYLRGSDKFYVGPTRDQTHNQDQNLIKKIIPRNEKYLPWRSLADKIDTVKDPDPAAGEIHTLVIGHQRTHLESINCCESGSTANGLDRTFCISVAFVVLSWASPNMGIMSLPSLVEMFLAAIVAFQGEGYSWVRHTSWKLKRHAVRNWDIIRPERKNIQCDNFKYKLPTLNNHKNFLFGLSVAHLVLTFSTGFAFIPFNGQKKLRNLQLVCQETNEWFDMQPCMLLATNSKLTVIWHMSYMHNLMQFLSN